MASWRVDGTGQNLEGVVEPPLAPSVVLVVRLWMRCEGEFELDRGERAEGTSRPPPQELSAKGKLKVRVVLRDLALRLMLLAVQTSELGDGT